MQECTTFLFYRKKTKNNNKNVRKTCYWKLIFVISREQVGTQSTQGTWARKHARHVGTWARKHARHSSCLHNLWSNNPQRHSEAQTTHCKTWFLEQRIVRPGFSNIFIATTSWNSCFDWQKDIKNNCRGGKLTREEKIQCNLQLTDTLNGGQL